jgi:hypothetical protein
MCNCGTEKEAMVFVCPGCGCGSRVVSKFCGHCGQKVSSEKVQNDANMTDSVLGSVAGRSQPESLAIILLAVPILGVVLELFWIPRLRLIDNPGAMLGLVVALVVFGTSVIMAVEASQLRLGTPLAGRRTTGPVGWLVCGLLLWAIAVPWYLWERRLAGVRNMALLGVIVVVVFVGSTSWIASVIWDREADFRSRMQQLDSRMRQLDDQLRSLPGLR